MKDKQIIQRLHMLKSVEPDAATLRLIRSRVSSPVSGTAIFSFKKWLIKKPLVPLLALASLLIVFTALVYMMPNFVEDTIISGRVIIASNHYEKAKIALSNVQNKVNSLQENSPNSSNMKQLSNSLSLANKEMSGLQLVGEKGKYTSYQCEELYESYHKKLQTIKDTIGQNNSEGKALFLQTEQYDKQANEKLTNYKHHKWQNSEK